MNIKLSEGSGGREMNSLVRDFRKILKVTGEWKHTDNDAAIVKINDDEYVCMTSDSFVVDPIFFPGGNIGDLAFCGTVNDLLVMGCYPKGLSLSFVIEEGFPKKDLDKILESIQAWSKKTTIPIVTGDTKVMEKGKLDKIIINTTAVGICTKEEIIDREVERGDKIILSGGLGEHAVALLSKRFDYETSIKSDSAPLVEELTMVKKQIKQAKDPTRGGLAATLNEFASKYNAIIEIDETSIPIKKEVKSVTKLLGLDPYVLACEGRFVCTVGKDKADDVLKELKVFNKDAAIIGEVKEIKSKKPEVLLLTKIGKRILHEPSGNIVPRIC